MTGKRIFSEATEARFRMLVEVYPEKRSALIPMLLAAQQEQGWVQPESIEYIAEYLGLSPSDVESVVSFYTLLNRNPVGKHLIHVCTNLACMLRGSDDIERALRDKLGVGMGQTTQDGRFSLVEAECLGSCTTAPVIQVNGGFRENLTPEKVATLLDELD